MGDVTGTTLIFIFTCLLYDMSGEHLRLTNLKNNMALIKISETLAQCECRGRVAGNSDVCLI